MDLTAGRELGVEDTRLRVSGCGAQRAQHAAGGVHRRDGGVGVRRGGCAGVAMSDQSGLVVEYPLRLQRFISNSFSLSLSLSLVCVLSYDSVVTRRR